MPRPKSSFTTAQLAMLLAVALPLMLLMFAAVRARQLQSTANPRWAQFAKFSSPTTAKECANTPSLKPPVQTASLSHDEFPIARPAPSSSIEELSGSVTGRNSIEVPVRTHAANLASLEPDAIQTVPKPEPNQKHVPSPSSITPAPHLILFRPVDEDEDPAIKEAAIRLETQLREVDRRLNHLSLRQEELVRQRIDDAKQIEQRMRETQRALKKATPSKSASIAALHEWLNEEHPNEQRRDELPRTESASSTDHLPKTDGSRVTHQPVPQPAVESAEHPANQSGSDPLPTTHTAPAMIVPRLPEAKTDLEVPVPPRTTKNVRTEIAQAELTNDRGETVVVKPPEPQESISIHVSDVATDVVSFDVRDGDVREFFYKLSQAANVGILVSPEVSGSITLSVRNVQLETALNAIAKSRAYVIERDGEILHVSTIEEASRLQQQPRPLVMRVYQPSFLSADELNRLIMPLLSKDGQHSSSAPADQHGSGDDVEETTLRDSVVVYDHAEVHDRIKQILVEMDVPPLQVEIEAQILSVTLPQEGSCGIDLRQLPCVATAEGQNGSSTGDLKHATLTCGTPAFINSVSRLGETHVVSTQRIQVLNKRRAEMLIGDRIGYQSCSDGSIQFLESGTRLVFRPSISVDGWIRMDVQPGHHSVQWNKRNKAPRQHLIEISTQVLVPNGATIAIGGLITEQTVETTRPVPVVGSLPVVGSHFRHRQDHVQRNELIILVTSKIVADCETNPEVPPSPGITHIRAPKSIKDPQRLDRVELARAHYIRAAALLQQGNMVKARQQIAAALHQNQHDAAAITLRHAIDQSLAQHVTR